jgi:hypothetical protein
MPLNITLTSIIIEVRNTFIQPGSIFIKGQFKSHVYKQQMS